MKDMIIGIKVIVGVIAGFVICLIMLMWTDFVELYVLAFPKLFSIPLSIALITLILIALFITDAHHKYKKIKTKHACLKDELSNIRKKELQKLENEIVAKRCEFDLLCKQKISQYRKELRNVENAQAMSNQIIYELKEKLKTKTQKILDRKNGSNPAYAKKIKMKNQVVIDKAEDFLTSRHT